MTKPLHKIEKRARSSFHIQARQLIEELWPSFQLLEEVYLPGVKLYADFFLPQKMMIIEVHGPQHYHFTPFLQKNMAKFLRQRENDQRKKEFCELNHIRLIALSYKEMDTWRTHLINA